MIPAAHPKTGAAVVATRKTTIKHAIKFLRAGNLREAESACRAIIARDPGALEAVNLLGILSVQTGRFDAAVDCFRQVLIKAPGNPTALCNLAEALCRQGRPGEAVPLLRQASVLDPGLAAAHVKLVTALIDAGRPDEALAACRHGLRLHPRDTGLNGLATDLLMRQRPHEAVPFLIATLEQAPEVDQRWAQLEQILITVSLRLGPVTRPLLLRALAHPVVRPSEIALSIARSLCEEPPIAELMALAANDALTQGLRQAASVAETLAPAATDALLLTLMETVFVPWPPLERLFTAVRRALLLEKTSAIPSTVLPFCTALATQAFLTDYAWYVTGDEETALAQLAARIAEGLRDPAASPALPFWLAMIGAYRPLHEHPEAARIAALRWPEPLLRVIHMQIDEPLMERALRAEIPRLTPVDDPISREVRAQYEESPYPRWTRAHRAPTPVSLPAFAAAIGATLPEDPTFATPDVLIAGCGTGLQALSAASVYRDARILAVDLSLASLAYALRKTQELGLKRIDYRQADILALTGLGRSFHAIECCGVLHHLADPLAGWRVLVDLLRPGGLMYIALYSELARRAVVLGREHVASHGYAPTAADIRRCRRDILALPDEHPLAPLRRMRDLYNTSECRDLLFHVQEHRYTVPEIARSLDTLGLRFLAFINLADPDAYRRRFPDDPGMRSLEHWHEFEQAHPDTFSGMYHFWVQKA